VTFIRELRAISGTLGGALRVGIVVLTSRSKTLLEKLLVSTNVFGLSHYALLFSRLPSKNIKIRIYKTIILPVVLYGCDSWTLTLREEHRLRVFEIRGLRRIFGPKRNEVTGGWRKLHNEELHNLYISASIIRMR
jgi:hypothetical protein